MALTFASRKVQDLEPGDRFLGEFTRTEYEVLTITKPERYGSIVVMTTTGLRLTYFRDSTVSAYAAR
jgi:hypothetical protein